MKKHEFYTDRIKLLREELIKDISTEMIRRGAEEINLHSGIIFNYIDDQMNEVISTIRLNGTVVIDTGVSADDISFKELSTDQLITILEMIEKDEFEIVEELTKE
jgi:hypothetical protein